MVIASRYRRSIRKLVDRFGKDVHRQVKRLFERVAVDAAMDDSIASQSRILINALLRKWEPIFSDKSKRYTDRMVGETLKQSNTSVSASLKEISKYFTLDPDRIDEETREIIKASTEEAANLIKLIPQKYLGKIQGAVMRSITSGEGLKELLPVMSKYYGEMKRHSRNVALDQTRKAYNSITAGRLKALNVQQFEWIHSGGGQHPRKQHERWSGRVFRFDDLPVDEKFGPVLPGQAINCFPSSGKVSLADRCHKLFRRPFRGELTTLVTESGATLEATPNHPILTGRGWLPAQHVEVGDYLFHAGRQGRHGAEADEAQDVAVLGDFFDALATLVGCSGKIAGSALFEFHGDMSDGEVDVIDVDSLLPDEWQPEICERICELLLAWADENPTDVRLLGECPPYELIVHAFLPTNSIVRRFSALLALFGSHTSHARDAHFRAASYVASVLNEALPYGRPADAIFARQFNLAQASGIRLGDFRAGNLFAAWMRSLDSRYRETTLTQLRGQVVGVHAEFLGHFAQTAGLIEQRDRVVEKGIRKDFSGHVFNLETSSGWYSVNGIIAHNCKCTMRPVIRIGENDGESD